MTFQEIIPELSSQIISLVKDGIPVPAKLSYVPEIIYNEDNGTQKTQTTKRKVRLLVMGKLEDNATYTLQYTPDKKTVVASRSYKTAAPLEVTRIEMLSYSKVCLYVNNRLDDSVVGGY